ncbi:MAG: PD40 domain-containing protein [Acidobacteria bacterium]|nr:PD40 domain-containing protein [Acidobacteriota bacterium]
MSVEKLDPGCQPEPLQSVPAHAVREELARVLASETFRHSERLCRFLQFAVDQQLAGNADQIKESVVAVEIFDRKPTHNSRMDSIVRVEARRLREKLDRYYAMEGENDPIIVGLPKGSYVPSFALRSPKSDPVALPSRVARRRLLPIVGLVLLLSSVAGVYWYRVSAKAGATSLKRLTADSGITFSPALSLDGKVVAYSSDRGGQGDLNVWVQQVGGGQPVRLTDNPADDLEPSLSPDGGVVAYRAEGAEAGIRLVPAFGGTSTLLVRGGYRPRFSPDGSRIAYWTGERMFRTARTFVIALAHGTPSRLQPDFPYAAYPVWAPDGEHLLFVGNQDASSASWDQLADWDWWVTPAGGGAATRTSARTLFTQNGLQPPPAPWSHRRIIPAQWVATGHIIFAAMSRGETNIWRVRISPQSWQVSGPPEQLTFGSGREDFPSMAADGSFSFSVLRRQSDVWRLPADTDTAKVQGPPVRITSHDATTHSQPVVSQDGKRLAYISNRGGSIELWVRSLDSKLEKRLTESQQQEHSPVISLDGQQIAFGYSVPRNRAIFAMPFEGGPIRQICSDCGEPRGWLPKGEGVLFQRYSGDHSLIAAVDPSGRISPLLKSSESTLFSPSVSRDRRWLALIARTAPDDHRIVVAPFRPGGETPRPDWITVSGPGAWFDKPRWSPNGRFLYYFSNEDGFICIWARGFDPAAGKVVGEPKPVAHFHVRRNSLGIVEGPELSVAADRLVFNLSEDSGDLWLSRR